MGYWLFLGAVLFPYFMSGLWKLIWGFGVDLFFSEMSFWNPETMSYMVAQYLNTIEEDSWLGQFLIVHTWIGLPLLLGGMFIELSVLVPMFRPKLWKLVAISLVLFHLLSIWILNIEFGYNILFMLTVLFFNPFSQRACWPKFFSKISTP